MMGAHLLTSLLLAPLLTAAILCLLPNREEYQRVGALTGAAATLALSVVLALDFRALEPGMQFAERAAWIPSLGISWSLGIDGISLFLVLLTTILLPIVIVASQTAIQKRWKEYYVFLMLLQTAMLGAFLALDAILFYVFWEAMLVPMYFLIGIWGGERRLYAAVKFFLYTAVGSLLMLVAILWVYFAHHSATGEYSAAWADLLKTPISAQAQMWLFAAFGLAFAIKVPMFPLHTWLPDAHVEAPTGGSVILAAVLLKMGTYGFLRWAMPLFPAAAISFSPLILTLGAVGVIYGALVALVQPDMKKLIAYSSVSHLGYVMLGLFAMNGEAVTGAVLQMINHGISTGALFLLVGVIYERRHTREIAKFGGLAKSMPLYATIFLLVTLSSIGLPGTNGFVGEFLILIGTYRAQPAAAVVGAAGVVLGAVYMLWLYQRVCLGPITDKENEHVSDASGRELLYLLPAIAAILLVGIYPRPLLDRIEPAVNATLETMHARTAPAVTTAAPELPR
ncbi:MAG TPA: NADH-quinone oxidoreductase subunit M [bacterium]|nr:NADH-quinone oxidoreductase subunit M [bacterium]